VGWKAIATRLNVSPRTAVRWADAYALPVQRVPRGGRPLVFAEVDELDRWWRSAAGAQARRETAHGDLSVAQSDDLADAGMGSPMADVPHPRGETRDLYAPRTVSRVVVGVGVTLAVIAAMWGTASWRASPRGHGLTLPSRLADGAHGEAVSGQLVELRVTVTGRPEAKVQVAEGEMARIETAKTSLGLQARQTGNRLTLLAYRLDPIGSGESATSIGSYSLNPRSEGAHLELGGEQAAVAWLGPLAAPAGRLGGREPCCMVCRGVTFCGQAVFADCGSCQGNQSANHDKGQ
jgi:hypothetical protein